MRFSKGERWEYVRVEKGESGCSGCEKVREGERKREKARGGERKWKKATDERRWKVVCVCTVDYAIPGTPASLVDSRLCHFQYYSSTAREGMFNSPRHPSSYPPDMNCTYEFFGEPNQQVRIIFIQFDVTESP